MAKNTQTNERWKIWLKQARFDLAAAFLSLDNEYFEWCAYQAEQAVEKALKAVIVQSNNKAPKIHKLGILFGYCNQINNEFKNTTFNFKHIESFTFISRYPLLLPDKTKTPHELITERDANLALVEASEILIKIGKILEYDEEMKKPRIVKEDLYTPKQIKERALNIIEPITKTFKTKEIFLFGNFARKWNEATSGTMDILIIADCDDMPFIDRIYEIRKVTRGQLPVIEPLIYTPKEIALLKKEGEGFLNSALSEGISIYKNEGFK